MNDSLLTYDRIDRSALTPMMLQYLDMKVGCEDAILMFRLGDFYEMFFDDAITASKVLELALTGRDCGLDCRAPMCGVPHHAATNYMQRLLSAGYKVAICDQIEDPATAKGIVKRAVTRILTPGTSIDLSVIDEKRNNYLICIYRVGMQFAISAADIATGELEATQLVMGNTQIQLMNLLMRYAPSEIVCNPELTKADIYKQISYHFSAPVTVIPSQHFSNSNSGRIADLTKDWQKIDDKRMLISCVSALLYYLDDTQKTTVSHFRVLRVYNISDKMELDIPARTNLELSSTIRSASKKGSLLWAIDLTQTSIGGRLLRKWLDEPLINVEEINFRQDAVEDLLNSFIQRQSLIDALSGFSDIERLSSKIALGSVGPRDLLSLLRSVQKLPSIYVAASQFNRGILGWANSHFDDLSDIDKLLSASISEDAPLASKEGGVIRAGYSDEVDQFRKLTTDGKQYILDLESVEREKTGIRNLKIGYNRVFGYYLEVSKAHVGLVPEHYVRKQTLANAERYVTDELKKLEDSILGANAKLVALEYQLFCDIRDQVRQACDRIYAVASAVAVYDVTSSLAELAQREGYVRPIVDVSTDLIIEEGRHPVVEKMMKDDRFVPNDTLMNEENRRIMVLTGPNMAGKSTYMRQVALIVLMAQMGAFVPAKYARIGVVDRIFTRIGASDDISSGQSTFMVEMNEVSSILRHATGKSLLLLDEVGRGTSTFDGLAIAWSILEFISAPSILFSRTIFATHYHELNLLEDKLPGLFNAHVEVQKQNGEVLFLHKIADGGTDDSYGIEVARLAGVPDDVILRARSILEVLESTKINTSDQIEDTERLSDAIDSIRPMPGQIKLDPGGKQFSKADPLRSELANLDISMMTPLEAMNMLYVLIEKAKESGQS